MLGSVTHLLIISQILGGKFLKLCFVCLCVCVCYHECFAGVWWAYRRTGAQVCGPIMRSVWGGVSPAPSLDSSTIFISTSSPLLKTKPVWLTHTHCNIDTYKHAHIHTHTLLSAPLYHLVMSSCLPGELYFMSTGIPSATSPSGVVYKVVDPSRWLKQ